MVKVLWFIPTSGDGRYLGTGEQGRSPKFGYRKQIAQAAAECGFYGTCSPQGAFAKTLE